MPILRTSTRRLVLLVTFAMIGSDMSSAAHLSRTDSLRLVLIVTNLAPYLPIQRAARVKTVEVASMTGKWPPYQLPLHQLLAPLTDGRQKPNSPRFIIFVTVVSRTQYAEFLAGIAKRERYVAVRFLDKPALTPAQWKRSLAFWPVRGPRHGSNW